MTERDVALELTEAYVSEHPVEAARLLESRPMSETAALLERMEIAQAIRAVRTMTPGAAAEVLSGLPVETAAALLQPIATEESLLIVRRIAPASRESLLAALPRRAREQLRSLLYFHEQSVGALMQTDVFSVPAAARARAARARARRRRESLRYYVYATDERGRLVGVLTLRDLMFAPPEAPIASIMQASPTCIPVDLDHRSLLQHPGWQHFHALPVVNADNVLVGRVRYETLRNLQRATTNVARSAPGAIDLAVGMSEAWLRGMAMLMRGLVQGDTPPR